MAEKEKGSKVSIVRIIQVLLRESDKDHPLTQQDILQYVEEKYGMVISRKSISRNLARLREAGLPVKCREVPRVVNGKETLLSLDWYWDHVVSREEMKLLIDLLYFSHLPLQQVKQLSEKLKQLQICSFEDGKEGIRNLLSNQKPSEGELVALLTQAIGEKKQVSFFYDHYEADGKRHHNGTPTGEDKRYRLNPYQLIASDDRYYVLGNQEGREDISVFLLDLLSDIQILETPARLQKQLDSQAKEEKLTEFLLPYQAVYAGSPEICQMEVDWHLMNDIVLDFGKAAHVLSASQDKVTVEVHIQASALKAWVLKHAPRAKIISPSHLVKEVKEAAQELARLYGA